MATKQELDKVLSVLERGEGQVNHTVILETLQDARRRMDVCEVCKAPEGGTVEITARALFETTEQSASGWKAKNKTEYKVDVLFCPNCGRDLRKEDAE